VKEMETEKKNTKPPAENKSRLGCLQMLGVITVVIIVTGILTAWWVKHYIYASPFTPTKLNAQEQKILDTKLTELDEAAQRNTSIFYRKPLSEQTDASQEAGGALVPEPYTEKGAKREISLTEKELNALIANNPEMAQRVAIDLSENLVSIKLVVPMDQDILILGGKTLRINMGAVLSYENDQPVVALKGVSLGGVPLPNAWLGNLKNKNLVEEFGTEEGFWKLFADGVQDLTVKEGYLQVRLKE
jgi:hypothetical protein